jgi:hypothetical protein
MIWKKWSLPDFSDIILAFALGTEEDHENP